uniref:3-cyclic-nucleotide phosphodiesterase n=1 Tax=Tetraselmis sp. GSL018 TaxID=582737 RepID=A0A061SN98_9CHLO
MWSWTLYFIFAMVQLCLSLSMYVNLCVVVPGHTGTSTPEVQLPSTSCEIVKTLIQQAKRDVKTRNCTLLGQDCVILPSQISVEDISSEVIQVPPGSKAKFLEAVSHCKRNGHQTVLGTVTHIEHYWSDLVDYYGMAAIGYSAAVAGELGQAVHGGSASNWFLASYRTDAVAALLRRLGVGEVSILYQWVAQGNAVREILEKSAIHVALVSAGIEPTCKSISAAFDALEQLPSQVVLLLFDERTDVLRCIPSEASLRGFDRADTLWIDIQGTLQEMARLGDDRASLDFSSRLLSVDASAPEPSETFEAHMMERLAEIFPRSPVSSGTASAFPAQDRAALLSMAATIYDAVWAAALAWSQAARNAPKGANATPRDVALQIAKVSFQGASGKASWSFRGRRLLKDVAVHFLKPWAEVADTESPLGVGVVGMWTVAEGLQMESDHACYRRRALLEAGPDSECSSCTREIWLSCIGTTAGLLCLQLLAYFTFSVVRKRQGCKLDSMQRSDHKVAEHGIDLRSPLAKILEFLETYEKGRVFRRPTRETARNLRHLVMANSHRLAKPADLVSQLSCDGSYSQDVVSYIASTTQGDGESRRLTNDWDMQIPSSRLHSFDLRMTTSPDLPGSFSGFHVRRQPSFGKESGRLHIDPAHSFTSILERRNSSRSFLPDEDESAPGSSTKRLLGGPRAAPRRSRSFNSVIEQSSHLKDLKDIPGEIIATLGRDTAADFISSSSPLRQCRNPLVLVVKAGIEALHLGKLLRHRQAAIKLLNFASFIEEGYPDEGFHCKLHAADVTNRFITIIEDSGIAYSNSWVRLAAVIAAAVHDYQHPQMTNSFLVVQEDHIAQQFNDQAVAENFSLREGLNLLKQDDLDFISAACLNTQNRKDSDLVAIEARNRKLRQTFRKTVIQTVLATDMARHFDVLGCFNANVASDSNLRSKRDGTAKWNVMTESQQLLTLQVAIKVADLGHCALPFPQHQEWVMRLQEEMFSQGDVEKSNALDVSPMMDRDKGGVCSPESQVGFFEVIVLPLFTAWVEVFPENYYLLQQAKANHSQWQAMMNTAL